MLRNAILGFLALSAFAAAAAQASDVTLWAVDTADGKVRIVSQSTGQVLAETTITQGGTAVDGVQGMARDPGTGEVYLAYSVGGGILPPPVASSFGLDVFEDLPAPTTYHLGILDLGNASVSNIGTTGKAFTGMGFANPGDLFGVYRLFGDVLSDVNVLTALPADLDTLSGSSPYAPIAFNPGDGMMYRAYSGGFQKFDPYAADASDSEVAITLSGATPTTISSLVWDSGGYFLATDLNFDIYRITPTGDTTASVAFVTQINGGVWPPLAPIIIINPEPASLALYGLGLLAVAGMARRRRTARAG